MEKFTSEVFHQTKWGKTMYMYINKDGNPSTRSIRHVEANVNTRKEN